MEEEGSVEREKREGKKKYGDMEEEEGAQLPPPMFCCIRH
jgi:hypothetical protein